MNDAEPQPPRRGRAPRSAVRYEPLDGVLVRAPLLPVEAYLALPTTVLPLTGPSPGPSDDLVRSALAVGSPDLLAQLERRATGTRGDARAIGKLLRFVIRMSTRPTPFGLFAGVALADLGSATDLSITGPPRTRTRPDMAWLLAFVAALEERPEVRRELRVFANPAVWLHAERALLYQRAAVDGGGDADAVGVRASGAVRRVLELARTPIAWSRLAAELLSTRGATEEKVDDLLTQLWQQTFLLTELRPPLTGVAPARHVAACLTGVPAAARERDALEHVLDSMATWDGLDLALRPAAHRALRDVAAVALSEYEGPVAQVDSALALGGHAISAAVGRAAARAAQLLVRLGPPAGAAGRLDRYRDAFLDRYGADREIALPHLLDPERGLGPPDAPRWTEAPGSDHHGARRRATLLRAIAADALRDRRIATELDEATLSNLERARATPATAPVSLDLSVFVLASCADAIDAGDFRITPGPNLGAASAGRHIGRFADMLGEEATRALATIAAREIEYAPADLHAELVYLPRRGRAANLTIRPLVRSREVVTGTTPGVDPEHAIALAELVVGVRDGSFYVRWEREPGDLRVHSGHMLNPRGAPAHCRFLEDVASAGRTSLQPFQWETAADLPFLPRIEVGRVVLSPARWHVGSASLAPAGADFAGRLQHWRDAWMVPRRVYVSSGDNRLLLDLDELAQADQLRRELQRLRRDAVLVLEEPLPGPEHAWLPGPDGHRLPELVIPLVLLGAPTARTVPARTRATAAIEPRRSDRMRPPGSDWLYAKLYGPRDGQDDLLALDVRDFAQFAVGAGLADRWFFVRYSDPHPHLRVRFGGEPQRLLGDLLPRLCSWAGELIAAGTCERLALDTYEREIERYGGIAAIGLAEAIFAADSVAAAGLLALTRSGLASIDRTTLTVVTVDALLDGLGLATDERAALYRTQVAVRHASGEEYRSRRDMLRRLLGEPAALADESGGAGLAAILRARSDVIAPLGERLRALERGGALGKPLHAICQSYVHMHCNRLLNARAADERVVLGLLLRTREGLERAPARRAR